MGNANARADAKRYREGYPGLADNPAINENLQFYSGTIRSVPSGDFVDSIHEKWFGHYDHLESHHGFIQWIFPIREHGMNMQAQPLQPHEADAIRASAEMKKRVLKSYQMMLDFYGMRLVDAETGEVERNPDNYEDRYENLNWSSHNYLRITRILKSLGELGWEHLKFPWCKFFVKEVFEQNQLPNCRNSLISYWIPVLRREEDRNAMRKILSGHGIELPPDDADEGDNVNPPLRSASAQAAGMMSRGPSASSAGGSPPVSRANSQRLSTGRSSRSGSEILAPAPAASATATASAEAPTVQGSTSKSPEPTAVEETPSSKRPVESPRHGVSSADVPATGAQPPTKSPRTSEAKAEDNKSTPATPSVLEQ